MEATPERGGTGKAHRQSRSRREFLNTHSEVYREKKLAENPPTRREAVRMMAKEPGLIRRPLIVAGGRVVLGFDEKGMARLF